MIQLFAGLTLVNLLALLASGAVGYAAVQGHDTRSLHTLAGALSTLVCCGVHSVVFTYFIATAKWVQHAVAVKHLDPAFTAPTRSFKAQAFPAALAAIAVTFATAMLGAARDTGMMRRGPHGILAIAAVVTNILCAAIEYRAIRRNASLIDCVLEKIEQQNAAPVAQRQRQRT